MLALCAATYFFCEFPIKKIDFHVNLYMKPLTTSREASNLLEDFV